MFKSKEWLFVFVNKLLPSLDNPQLPPPTSKTLMLTQRFVLSKADNRLVTTSHTLYIVHLLIISYPQADVYQYTSYFVIFTVSSLTQLTSTVATELIVGCF